MLEFFRPICAVRSSFRDCFGCCVMIYYINCALVSRRPEMVKEIGFKKWSRGWTCGLPTDSPHALFLGLLKSVPGLCELDQNRPYVVCLNC